ncbi:biotin--[acetyl-CoA-carboxylase] ligase [Chlamydia buteonis]|uniref:Biotin--[acetyl-CoA-carboxylase] ligase n=1 Tax=Chlamydia buteonis TaxID=2494525 RepID=A0ABX8LDB7_9CHLA|nr:biotin--[acetyl-CoA-carboxylase] ligase [Chlamydia buteonis]QXE26757.1 biotin--[acetyl-CoA-carboxylase] ligase [Chlamydia buteonis]QXE28288.1 biotin--[acetyl-CoA-carboxylase] ligase [Chlamydia buteonis]
MKVIYYEIAETPSTNATAKQLMHVWNPFALTVVSTQKQTDGKGKFNKSWVSSNKDLALSLCFFITELDIDVSLLFRLGTEAVLELIQDLGITNGTIKWPNDVLVNGEKLCGVLSETLPSQGYLGIVLGIGINGNSSKEDLASIEQPATSLSILLKHTIDLKEIRNKLVEHVQKCILQRFPKILAREMNRGQI